MASTAGSEIPIGMLVASISSISDKEGELFGFWYFKEVGLPHTKEERKGFFGDLMRERCCQVSITGSFEQLEELVRIADHFEKGLPGNSSKSDWTSVFEFLKSTSRGAHIFDDLMKPKGISLPLDLTIKFNEDMESLRNQIHSKRDVVRLHLQAGWSPMSDLMRDFLSPR